MKLDTVRIQSFRRFTDLVVRNIPSTASLIVLIGPNGCGKSSFFDALHTWHTWKSKKIAHGMTNTMQRWGRPDQADSIIKCRSPFMITREVSVRRPSTFDRPIVTAQIFRLPISAEPHLGWTKSAWHVS